MYVGKVKGKEAKRRSKLWFVRDRAAGICDYYATEKEAKEIAEDFNSEQRRRSKGLQPTNKALKKWSVQLLVRSYMHSGGTIQSKMSESGDSLITATHEAYNDEEDLIESCGLQDNFSSVLLRFSSDPICQKSLFDFTHQVAEKYVADQLRATYISNGSDVEKRYAPGTIRRNITAIQNVWEWGRRAFPQLANLQNPWERIRINGGSGGKRQRGLRRGELERMLEACERCRGTNRYYVPLAIQVAVDTGMRRQEIFNLTWQHIDFDNRRITIEHDKNSWRRSNGEGRVICLPPVSQLLLNDLCVSLKRHGCLPDSEQKIPPAFHPPHGKIFMGYEGKAMTGNGFKQAFDQVREWAGIVDTEPRKVLTPHSLRAAAQMLFRRADMNGDEIDMMKNGVKDNYDTQDDFLDMIQKKLDRAFLGKPLAEAMLEWEEYKRGLSRIAMEVAQEGLPEDASAKKVRARLDKEYPRYDEIKAMLASLPSRQARLAEEVT